MIFSRDASNGIDVLSSNQVSEQFNIELTHLHPGIFLLSRVRVIKGTVVNRTLLSLHGRALEIALTVFLEGLRYSHKTTSVVNEFQILFAPN